VEGVGPIRIFAALASIASAIAHAIIVDPLLWTLLPVAHGACYACLIIVIESWLNAATDRRHRGQALVNYSIVLYAAWAAIVSAGAVSIVQGGPDVVRLLDVRDLVLAPLVARLAVVVEVQLAVDDRP
jgi:uncharacterized membrane protein